MTRDAAWWRDYRARKKEPTDSGRQDAKVARDRIDWKSRALAAEAELLSRSRDHVQCDARIAELEGSRNVVRNVDNVDSAPTQKPAFLRAPDDDCGLCGHDRQQWHLGPTCQKPVAVKFSQAIRCGCPTFVEAGEPPL